jgi:hypothetical protein
VVVALAHVMPFSKEVRTTSAVEIGEAVWLLATKRIGEHLLPDIPAIDTFEAKYGQISKSYWHRSHQMGILREWRFMQLVYAINDCPLELTSIS